MDRRLEGLIPTKHPGAPVTSRRAFLLAVAALGLLAPVRRGIAQPPERARLGVLSPGASTRPAFQGSIAAFIPAVYLEEGWIDAGGLLAYAPSLVDQFTRAATLVDRILRGARPADLPVQQAATFDLVINRKAAQALGLTIPPSMLVRASRVVE